MVKALLLLILSTLLLSGCTASTGNVAETTKLGMPEIPVQTQETIEELHKDFEEFEKSQNETLSEENEAQEEAAAETAEEDTTPEEATSQEETEEDESIQRQCPSCGDSGPCTTDSCSEETDYECVHEPVIPCCGNGECEQAEDWSECPQDCPKPSKPSAIFSELSYNPPGSDSGHEWIEVYNNGSVPIDVTKLRFEEGGTQHTIKSVTEAILNPHSYCAIAENATQFLSDYPGYAGLLFDSSFSLSNSGEELVIRAGKDGEIMDTLLYNSTWGGDGSGFSLEKIDLSDSSTQENWNSSLVEGGTPGQKNSIS